MPQGSLAARLSHNSLGRTGAQRERGESAVAAGINLQGRGRRRRDQTAGIGVAMKNRVAGSMEEGDFTEGGAMLAMLLMGRRGGESWAGVLESRPDQ